MSDSLPLDVVIGQRQRLLALIDEERERIAAFESVVENLVQQMERHQHVLDEIDSVLGMTPQLRLDDASIVLRGRRLAEVAVEVLESERGKAVEVHYREWFGLVKAKGHMVAGKEPLNTFLTQINRAPNVERVGSRTGLYRLSA